MDKNYSQKVFYSQADKDLASRTKWGAFFYLVLFSIIIIFSPYRQDYFVEVVILGLVLIAGMVIRSCVTLKFYRIYHNSVLVWRAGIYTGILIMAGAWGVFCMLAVTHYSLEWTAMLVLLCTAGLSAAAITSLSIYVSLINTYLILMLVPSIVSLLILGTQESYGVMMMFVIFIIYLVVAAKRLNREYWHALRNVIDIDRRARELEGSNKELEAYSYSIAHDLRAPLRSITAYSQILLEDANAKLNVGEKDSLQRIVKAGKFMALLIDDILELSRISRTELHRNSVNLSKQAEDCVQRLMESNRQRHIDWKIQPNLNAIGDSRLLNNMLYNLLDNAVKFTGRNADAEIKFGTMNTDDLEESLRVKITDYNADIDAVFYVTDNGVGFDMKYADKLFGIFQRLHSADEFEGTGIGLATVARIIHRHGGHVWAQSGTGKGATFYFTLSDQPLVL